MNALNRRPKILIVDDEPCIVNYIKTCLQYEYEVVAAFSANEAIELMKIETPDLITTDIMMPGTDGYTLARKIKKQTKTKDTPIIFISAKNEFNDRIKGFESGAHDYIEKPFRPTELLTVVANNLRYN